MAELDPGRFLLEKSFDFKKKKSTQRYFKMRKGWGEKY